MINTKRSSTFSSSKATVTNNTMSKVSDIDILNKNGRVLYHLSLKFSPSFYIYNGSYVINYFKSTNKRERKMINEFFGFDGFKMAQAFGKEYAADTIKNYNYASILRRFKDLLNQCLGSDIVLVSKIANNNNHISYVKGLNHKITLSGLSKDSYDKIMKWSRIKRKMEKGCTTDNVIDFSVDVGLIVLMY